MARRISTQRNFSEAERKQRWSEIIKVLLGDTTPLSAIDDHKTNDKAKPPA